MNKKVIISILIIISSCLLLLLFSSKALLLSFSLVLLALIKHKIYPIKKELLWYLFISFGGAIIEIVLVNIGGMWHYSVQHFFQIPIWMPLFWGVIGTTLITSYEGFTEQKPK